MINQSEDGIKTAEFNLTVRYYIPKSNDKAYCCIYFRALYTYVPAYHDIIVKDNRSRLKAVDEPLPYKLILNRIAFCMAEARLLF